ncbi:putative Holliday junction resolvase [Diachasmimorpha longicaudata entomopoxvirus]|uniref:Putative Holliday junction resolvase n=1 Tax=Diachasmimorpha longicaudata entomopoxvirus TaxID=109981 RepID=A0A7R5WMK2_9POXV|nr:putative Holliday junction resolvase [Diachasmimorpha longicaudata entomopoxvirus]AKS26404.1 putative Holliday junction resolvase [Diachasmimorpha longicaudata entomopoxvirus]
MRTILSIDVGLVKPGFIILRCLKAPEENQEPIVELEILNPPSCKTIEEMVPFLKSLPVFDEIIIEKQHMLKNVATMRFLQGFFVSKGTKVSLVPAASLNFKNRGVTRAEKKALSVKFANNLMIINHIDHKFLAQDSDITDAIVIGAKVLYLEDKGLLHRIKMRNSDSASSIDSTISTNSTDLIDLVNSTTLTS